MVVCEYISAVPIIYQVDRLRDGKSFATRRVDAIQKGNIIFTLLASFQVYILSFKLVFISWVYGYEFILGEILVQYRQH